MSVDIAQMSWRKAACAIRWSIRPFIDGRYRISDSQEHLENVNPATEEVLCHFSIGDSADVNEAVRVARLRFNEGCWSGLPPGRRAAILMKLADLVTRYHADIALLDTLEMGKPIAASIYDAQTFAPFFLRSCAGFADKLVGESAPLQHSTVAFNTYEPRGVVGAIVPWNFPIVNAVIKVAPALAAGNTVVLKPSELTPSSALKLAELAMEAGVPAGVLNVVPGLGATVGAALAMHSDVDLITFTGSTATGRRIMELSGRSTGKPLLLECGGKSPNLVFNDVEDLERVGAAIIESALRNMGQVCSARTRLLLHEDVKEPLLEQIVKRASKCRPADPLESGTAFGPLASPGQRDRVKRYVEEGVRAGAEAVLKGAIQERGGCYVSPTVFDRVTSEMSIAREEIFGPVLCVQTFQREEEAVALANGTDYGLSATVWTRDMGRAKRLARSIRAGGISICTSGKEDAESGCFLSSEPQKASGFGCELGIRGLQAYSNLKSVSFRGS